MHSDLLNSINIKPGDKIYFTGIGGISVSGLAEIASHLGFYVLGSDPMESNEVKRLRRNGIKIYDQQCASNITDNRPQILVYSVAVPDNNPELVTARSLNIPIFTRDQFLGWLSHKFSRVINVAGTHGKSTTTAMIALILMEAAQDPTVHLGAEFEYFADNSSVRLGHGDVLVSEADEYKRAFLSYCSTTSIILNIDTDHLDYYKDLDDIIDAYVDFACNLNADGNLIIPASADNMDRFLTKLSKACQIRKRSLPKIFTYGKFSENSSTQPDYFYKDLSYQDGLPHYSVYKNGELLGEFHLNIPGEHNVSNSLAALAAADLNGADLKAVHQAFDKFHGAGDRFMHIGKFEGAEVITDYGHHPTEIEATLSAAESVCKGTVYPVIEILNYTRARDYHADYLEMFNDYSLTVYYKIYSSREKDTLGQSAERFAAEYNENKKVQENRAVACNNVDDLRRLFSGRVKEGDLILMMGAGFIRDDAVKLCRSNNSICYRDQKVKQKTESQAE